MRRWVALLKGVNVGGGNRLPMADLRGIADALGWQSVSTYIASGNMVFRAEGMAAHLARRLHEALPIDVPVMVLGADDFGSVLQGCPFEPEAGKLVHGMLCWEAPVLDDALLADLRTDEEIEVVGHTLWLHTPSGFSNSKVADKIGRITGGVEMTARNLNTLAKLAEMLDAMGGD